MIPGLDYEECDHNDEGFPDCDDWGCLSQICVQGPLQHQCGAGEVSLPKLMRDKMLAESQGAAMTESIEFGALALYSGVLSTAMPEFGDENAVAEYVAYKQRNLCRSTRIALVTVRVVSMSVLVTP
jgi:hypothetical protein